MLSRYRSVSGLALPRGSRAARTNNPVSQFESATTSRFDRLREQNFDLLPDTAVEEALIQHPVRRDGPGVAGSGPGPGPSPAWPLATSFRLWDGPLAGVAHQAGQFPGLAEGPAGEDVPQPPADLARALAADLDLLAGLAEQTQDIMYDAGGSESDFAVVPIILEPRPAAAAAAPAGPEDVPSLSSPSASAGAGGAAAGTAGGSAAAAAEPAFHAEQSGAATGGGLTASAAEEEVGGVAAATLPAAEKVGDEAAVPSPLPPPVAASGSGGGGGSEYPWWSVAEARAAPLSWEEVFASLGIAPGLAARLQPVLELKNEDAFWSHLLERHIRKLEGGDVVAAHLRAQSGRRHHHHRHQQQQQQQQPHGMHSQQPPGGGNPVEPSSAPAAPQDAKQGEADDEAAGTAAPSASSSTSSAAAMAAAVRDLSGAIEYPALQVMVGSERLSWNPIPLMWLARSRRSGAILGLMTAVVWT